jgi:DNA primase
MDKPITQTLLNRVVKLVMGTPGNHTERLFKKSYASGLNDGVRLANLHYGYGSKMTKRIIDMLAADPALDFDKACDLAIQERERRAD